MKGTIFSWDANRGFGFVTAPSGRSLFFHVSHWLTHNQIPMKGMLVEFELGVDKRTGREQAVNVSAIGHPDFIALALPQQKAGS